MKKLISVLLALVLCCMMIPAMAESDSMAGVWYIGHATINGEPVVVYDPEVVTMTLLEDGTGVLAYLALGMQIDCTWSSTDSALTVAVEGQGELQYPIVDGEIELAQESIVLYMTRTPDDTPVDLPAAVEAESADAFDGKWVPSKVIAYGLLANVADVISGDASIASMKIEGGKVTYITDGSDELKTADLTLENGVLTGTDSDNALTTLTLLEDGSLMYTYSYMGMENILPSTYFYIPAEAAAE